MYLLYLLLKMVNFQLSHLGLSPKPVAPRWISAQVPCDRPSRRGLQLTRPKLQQLHAPRRHQWDHPPENGATLPASAKSSPTLQGGMEGGDGVPTNGRGGGWNIPHVFVWHWKDFWWIFCAMFFVRKISHQYKVRKTYLILDWFHQSEILQKTSHCVGIPSSKKNGSLSNGCNLSWWRYD